MSKLETLLKEADKTKSTYRTVKIKVLDGAYTPADPDDIPRLMEHFFNQIDSSRTTLHPIELAAMACKRFIEISPFEANNEDTAVSIMNYLLISYGYAPIIISNENKEEFKQIIIKSINDIDMLPLSEYVAEYLS